MKIVVRSNSVPLRVKGLVLSRAQALFPLIRGSARIASNWDPKSVGDASDSERCVEVPWVASAVSRAFGLWLDIGHANAEDRYWRAIYSNRWRRFFRYGYGLDIVLPDRPNPLPVHIVADLIDESLEKLPKFNLITCISTLEHIGCDNKVYRPDAERRSEPFAIQKTALDKLLGQLTPSGRLLISVPFGKYQDNGWFLQYDQGMVASLKERATAAGCKTLSEKYYRLGPQAWLQCKAEDMAEILYQPEDRRAAGVVLLEFAV